MKKVRKHRIRNIVILILVILAAASAVSVYVSQHCLQISHYSSRNSKIRHRIRVVEIADLHDAQFGRNNEKLLERVRQQKPDLIVIAGDSVLADRKDYSVAEKAVRGLCRIAPVYYGLGNHELEYQEKFGTDMARVMEKAGATVLNGRYLDVTVKDTPVRIGGIYGYCIPDTKQNRKEMTDAGRTDRIAEMDWMHRFENTDRLKILITHMPVAWISYGSLDCYDVDYVFAGHAHGGHVRLPFVGGLYAPDQGFFVGREEGLYTSTDKKYYHVSAEVRAGLQNHKSVLVLSRGLGNDEIIPRFNNPPQVIVMDLEPSQER